MSIGTVIDHRDRIMRVIRYIELHLGTSVNLSSLASIACYSPSHFHRQFSRYAGCPVSAYIRWRRMVSAARVLIRSSRGITDVALDSGYGSLEAFTKAFRRHFGVSPRGFRYRNRGIRPMTTGCVVLSPGQLGGQDRLSYRSLSKLTEGFTPWFSIFPECPERCILAGNTDLGLNGSAYRMRFPRPGSEFQIHRSGRLAVLVENQEPMIYQGGCPNTESSSLPAPWQSILWVPNCLKERLSCFLGRVQ